MKRIYLDTEFTGFGQRNPQLISLGMCADGAPDFYVELNDYIPHRCSEFVKQHVLPQLGRQPECVCNSAECRRRVRDWLKKFEADAVICCDLEEDWKFIENLAEKSWLHAQGISAKPYKQLDMPISCKHLNTHHALEDARLAMRMAGIRNTG